MRPAAPVPVELLLVENCPARAAALDLLRGAAEAAGVAVAVEETVLVDQRQAEARGFAGSPTFLIAGEDPQPPEPEAVPAIACRRYRTPAGVGSLPDRQAVERALLRAAGQAPPGGG